MSVVLTGRSRHTVQAAARSVGARGAVLDLGSLASVRAFAAELAALTAGARHRGPAGALYEDTLTLIAEADCRGAG
jgi:hypothetical protein